MSESEQKVVDALQQLGMPYEIIRIDPAFSDTSAFCERYGYPPAQTCNTIIVTTKKGPKKYAVCVVPADTRLDVNKRVKNLLGAPKVSFATAEEMNELTGMEVGGVTPFSVPADLPLYVDERVMNSEWVVLGGGGRGIKIKISPDVFRMLGAEAVANLGLQE
jgi:Cys-tRNA(Pro) deacylase